MHIFNFFEKIPLCTFISSCTFINFDGKFHYARLFHHARLLERSEYLGIRLFGCPIYVKNKRGFFSDLYTDFLADFHSPAHHPLFPTFEAIHPNHVWDKIKKG